ncbi:uncharacterized protein UMAG_01667 [Mycosarcoma maydis]|uniref:C2H2-type domain-containing protein n=1 Tax=Mycosarcoma maydis TaxID=5270 RepID=A0A0D1E465_MYCMD|nr:uncharacterized protein UMAG_01667 [Ustilago maydis 521]KIS70496.1 hypothetical protein UMAG_01667 [Ustilago maydis 521]|eukprot:XP_011387650.1 hypothetical protein UMAG_01667 [Ustilago maydis 521]
MSASTFPPFGATIFASSSSTDSNSSDRIGAVQKFLLASDWSSLSSLSPPTNPVSAVAEESFSWPSSGVDVALFPSSVETVKPTMLHATAISNVVSSAPVSGLYETPAVSSGNAACAVAAAVAPTPSPLTPAHRQSFDTCYTDSVGSPDSERDFLTSPSMFDDNDFEFDSDTLANHFPLFTDQAYEDPVEPQSEDLIDAFASNVKLEATEHDSQLTETDFAASQSTVMPSQSQVKLEEDFYGVSSTLADAFKTEADAHTIKLEPKSETEHDVWSADELKPYFGDEDSKAVLLSSLANAFGHDLVQPIKESLSQQEVQKPSQVGPIRSTRVDRDRRSSPTKAAATSSAASPAPIIDPITKAKRWQCTECGKWFDRAYNLKTHRYTHEDPETRARPFLCPDTECEKQFARKHDMQRHFENVHRGGVRRAKSGSVKRSRADDLG